MIDRAQIAPLESPLFDEACVFLHGIGMKTRRSDGLLTGKREIDDVFYELTLVRKDYIPLSSRYELHYGVNWKKIYDLVWISRPTIPPTQWKKVTLASFGTSSYQSSDEYRKFSFNNSESFLSVCDEIIRIMARDVERFYDKWGIISRAMVELLNITEEATRVCPFPAELSMIAISMALVTGDREAAIHALSKHIDWLSDMPDAQMAKFQKFLHLLKVNDRYFLDD